MANKMTEAAIGAQRAYNNRYYQNMSPEQKERRKAYHGEWQKQHPDKIREYRRTYWERKGAQKSEDATK